MKTVALVVPKGGAGKTTLSTNLMVEAMAHCSSAIVDVDPIAASLEWADLRTAENPGAKACRVEASQGPRLYRTLKDLSDAGVELCIIDTPAQTTGPSLEAAKLADLVLLPVRLSLYDVKTLNDARTLLGVAGNPDAFVVVNGALVQGDRHDDVRAAAKGLGFEVCPTVLYHRAVYIDSANTGLGVRELQPKGRAAAEISDLFRFVAKHVNLKTRKPKEKS